MSPPNAPLEAFSGTWGILAAYCVVFLLIHLLRASGAKHLTWRLWLFRLPVGMQLALATATACLGVFLSRFAVWYWRFMTGGDDTRLGDQSSLLIIGAVVGCIGFLAILRVITRPMGRWPTLAAIASVLAYWATFLFR